MDTKKQEITDFMASHISIKSIIRGLTHNKHQNTKSLFARFFHFASDTSTTHSFMPINFFRDWSEQDLKQNVFASVMNNGNVEDKNVTKLVRKQNIFTENICTTFFHNLPDSAKEIYKNDGQFRNMHIFETLKLLHKDGAIKDFSLDFHSPFTEAASFNLNFTEGANITEEHKTRLEESINKFSPYLQQSMSSQLLDIYGKRLFTFQFDCGKTLLPDILTNALHSIQKQLKTYRFCANRMIFITTKLIVLNLFLEHKGFYSKEVIKEKDLRKPINDEWLPHFPDDVLQEYFDQNSVWGLQQFHIFINHLLEHIQKRYPFGALNHFPLRSLATTIYNSEIEIRQRQIQYFSSIVISCDESINTSSYISQRIIDFEKSDIVNFYKQTIDDQDVLDNILEDIEQVTAFYVSCIPYSRQMMWLFGPDHALNYLRHLMTTDGFSANDIAKIHNKALKRSHQDYNSFIFI